VGRPDIVYLVGFMGAGKTSIGVRLARMLRYSFIDLDQEIEARAGEPIRTIFASRGEPGFRGLESEELRRVSSVPGRVVALGGGAFCAGENREIVRSTGTAVWLDAPLGTLLRRVRGDKRRPLLSSRPEMERLLASRRPIYAEAAIRINVRQGTPAQIARRIARLLLRDA
jgi:shikimate kinase